MTKKEFNETANVLFFVIFGTIWLLGKSVKRIKKNVKQKRRNSF